MITLIRKSFLNAYTALPLLLCFVLASFNSFATTNKAIRTTFLSGQELFEGVFFLEGKYAQMLPETESLQLAYHNHTQTGSQKAAVSQVRQAILAQIESARPGYFSSFKSALKSGDHLRVSAALVEGQSLVGKAMDVLYKVDRAELSRLQAKAQSEVSRQGGKLDAQALEKLVGQLQKDKAVDADAAVGVCAVAVIVAVAAVVAAVVVIVAVFLVAEEMLASQGTSKSLLHEQLVASICNVAPQIA